MVQINRRSYDRRKTDVRSTTYMISRELDEAEGKMTTVLYYYTSDSDILC